MEQQDKKKQKVCMHCNNAYVGSLALHQRSIEGFIEQVKMLWDRIKDPNSQEKPPLNLEIDMSMYKE